MAQAFSVTQVGVGIGPLASRPPVPSGFDDLTPTLAAACLDTKNNSALPLTININYWKQS